MKIIHRKSAQDPTRGTMTSDVWYYQSEVLNDAAVPIRVIWFEFYYSHDGQWYGINKKNKVLQHDDFRAWYSDGEVPTQDAWIQPGHAWVCDPNWHLDFGHGFYQAKWAYLAVDGQGESYCAEALVPENVAERYEFR
jgi:hypothetical protein